MRRLLIRARRHWIAVSAGVVLGVCLLRISSSSPEFREALTERLPTYPIRIATRGQLRPGAETFVVVNRGGRLDRILKPAGTSVEKGDIIAVIDEITRKASLETALSQFRLANSNLARIRRLYRSGAASRQELDEAQSAFSVRQAELKSARQALEDGLARAPAAGQIALVAFSPGEVIPDGARVAVIEDHSSFRLHLALSRKWETRLKDRLLVEFSPKSAPAEGEILETRSGGADRIEIDVLFPGLPEGGQVGRTAEITVIPEVLQAAVKVPNSAFFRDENNRPFLLVRSGDGEHYRHFPDIRYEEGSSVIVSDLPAGLQVLTGERAPASLPLWREAKSPDASGDFSE